jgi:hypothetical protein
MTITTEFALLLDDARDAVMTAQLERPGMQRRLERALVDLQEIAAPAACYETHHIERVLHERLELAGGTRIGGGPLTSIVGGADELYVAVCTLGAALDERIREHRDEGRYLEMLLLDELGSWGVDQVREQLYGHVESEVRRNGRHLSGALSPGESSSWPIREQRKLFRLVDTTQIGVSLGAGDLMSPIKSLSLVFGAGGEPLSEAPVSRCHYCAIRDRCRFAA